MKLVGRYCVLAAITIYRTNYIYIYIKIYVRKNKYEIEMKNLSVMKQ